MTYSTAVTMAGLLGIPFAAAADPDRPETAAGNVSVRLHVSAAVSPLTINAAVNRAKRIFRVGGIQTAWKSCAGIGPEPDPSCHAAVGPSQIVILLVKSAPRHFVGLVLGSAIVTEDASYAKVYYEQVRQQAELARLDVGEVLGAAIAHEVGHLLLRSSGHGKAGLMKGSWKGSDLRMAAGGLLLFTKDEVAAMRNRLRSAEAAESEADLRAVNVRKGQKKAIDE
jgi:hypothetical protein